MSTHNIGNRCASIEIDQPWTPVSRVIVKVDENTSYSAGNTTGRTMEISCPIGTQTMANNLLTVFSGFVYKSYKATDALIKPSMELGDSVSIGGVYSIVGGMFIKGDMILAANLTAPSSGDIDHEYPYEEFRKITVAAKNIKHGGSYGTMHGSGISGHSISTSQTSSGINTSLADADFSADVFSGASQANYGKFGQLICPSWFTYKGHVARWEDASFVVASDLKVMCYTQ